MKNEPLTLDELKQMDGEKIWVDSPKYIGSARVCVPPSGIPLVDTAGGLVDAVGGLGTISCSLLASQGATFYRLPPYATSSVTAHAEAPSPEGESYGEGEKTARHRALCERIHAIYTRKNHDYGDSFHETFQTWGLAAAGVRMSDKLNRFIALSQSAAKVDNESLTDTLLDLANYAIMTVMELEDKE